MDMGTEMMSDAIDDALDNDEAEDETEELTNQLSSASIGKIAGKSAEDAGRELKVKTLHGAVLQLDKWAPIFGKSTTRSIFLFSTTRPKRSFNFSTSSFTVRSSKVCLEDSDYFIPSYV